MSIKSKRPLYWRLTYCADCERAFRGMYCTGKCRSPKRRKRS